MSAWIVSRKHIDLLVAAGRLCHMVKPGKETATGRMLWKENEASVRYRYRDCEDMPGSTFDSKYTFAGEWSGGYSASDTVVVMKAIDCYCYQSCEHPEWESSEARRYCDSLYRGMASRLPGYDAAPWGID